jgi:hypothetical protein
MALGGFADVVLWAYTRPNLFEDDVDSGKDEELDDTHGRDRDSVVKVHPWPDTP